jgi:3-hydroxyisobutyrate dehydrogenase
MRKMAFVGLGRMGHGMAARYLDAGFDVAVWNRSQGKADKLVARGARFADSPAAAAEGAEAIVTMVADDEASRAVWLGGDGIAVAAERGALAIECSTVSHLRARGLIYIDCPVTGLPEAAAAGKLTLLVGADAGDLDLVRPFLTPISTSIRHFGPVGAGTVYKLINNLIGAVQIASLAEGIAIAEQAGLDMDLVAEALATGAVASPQVIRHSKRMIARDFSGPSFTTALRHKDAVYAVELAEKLLPEVPVSRAAVAAYEKAKARLADDDEASMVELISRPKT